MPTLNERWDAHLELCADAGPEANGSFAITGEGVLVIFDPHGYFKIVSTGRGVVGGESVPNVLALESATGERESVYLEPIWLAGYFETVADTLRHYS